MRRTPLDPALVRDRFDYYDDGTLVWRDGVSRMAQPGTVAGCRRADGRWLVYIGRHTLNRSRAVWAWHNGEFPKGCLRHLNGDIRDDRIENLIEETYFERAIRIRNLSAGLPGARRQANGTWQANITVDGQRHYLGQFDTEAEAHEVFKLAHATFHGDQSPYYEGIANNADGVTAHAVGVHKCS